MRVFAVLYLRSDHLNASFQSAAATPRIVVSKFGYACAAVSASNPQSVEAITSGQLREVAEGSLKILQSLVPQEATYDL